MSDSFITCEGNFPKLRENFDNFGYILKLSARQNTTKHEVKIQVTSREIFATSLTGKGLISLISKKNFYKLRRKQNLIKLDKKYVHSSQENKCKLYLNI